MLTVKLYGPLRALCDDRRSIDLAVSSPAEAVRALSVLFPRFRPWLLNEGRTMPIKVAGTLPGRVPVVYREDTLGDPQSKGVLRLVPMVQGSGSRLWGAVEFVAGAALMYLSYGSASPYASTMMSAGLALAAGGASTLLAAHLAANASQQNSVNNQPSYAFNGAVNTTGQGGPVPLAYGRPGRIGGQVISVGFSTNNEVLV